MASFAGTQVMWRTDPALTSGVPSPRDSDIFPTLPSTPLATAVCVLGYHVPAPAGLLLLWFVAPSQPKRLYSHRL